MQEADVKELRKCNSFSLLTDETADISGKKKNMSWNKIHPENADFGYIIKEDFMSFVDLEK